MRRLDLLIFPDFQILDAAGPIAAFEIAERFRPGAYELHVVAAEPGPVRSSSGAMMLAEPLSEAAADTLVVSGGDGTRQAIGEARLLDWLVRASGRARRTASVCSGAYLLAQAGLLDGLRATTHWSRSADFARRYPKVRLEPDRIFTREGKVWTSAGITAGIDLALALIADDLGEDVARRVAQQLVVYHRRPGGQSQFSALLEMGGQGGRFAGLIDWMRERISEPLTIERLAGQAGMSARNFARAFAAETGVTPAKAVERLRLEVARERVEASAEPIDVLARAAGFGDPERMRRAFVRAFGQPPQALRRAARA
ncbi:GlxA family transcriptional regulator [Phenylobacterium sp.]|uniref:GlxA family transcriptional regulator n=1 Tax=Phenylobacterium sp. TaxID=1871053 RepID=UPI0035AEB342